MPEQKHKMQSRSLPTRRSVIHLGGMLPAAHFCGWGSAAPRPSLLGGSRPEPPRLGDSRPTEGLGGGSPESRIEN